MTTAIVRKSAQPIVVPRAGEPQPVVQPSLRVLREQRAMERERMLASLVSQWSEVAGRFLLTPPMMVLGGCALTNVLSQTQTGTYNGRPTYVIEGAISSSIQTVLVGTIAFQALTEVAKEGVKPAMDIASLIKLVGAL